MKRLNKQIVIIPSFILSLVIVWLISVHLPIQREMKIFDGRFDQLREKERKLVPESSVQIVRKDVDSLSTDIVNRMKRLFPEDRLLELGRVIDEIGTAYSLILISVTPDYEKLSLFSEEGEDISQLPLSMEFEGKFTDFTQFLDGIPNFPIAMHFDEVKLEKEDLEKAELKIEFHGTIVLKRLPKNESTEKVIASNRGPEQS